MTFAILLVMLLIAFVLAACVMSDALLQRLAMAVRGSSLEPRLLLTVRKIGYVILVVYLFTFSFLWRRVVVDASATQLAVREQSRGDVHLTGSLVRLSLGGFRGVTTCYLWNLAMDKQMKNQLNELEVIVGWLTELQPHFNTPWLFQSWNLAYNVSNKTDRISDKYFYITRGIRLLADGERQNHDDPDLRFELATTYQHKICQSDETNVHRSLFQLSLIPPNERDPARFSSKGGRQKMDKEGLKEFIKFCEKHPQLIRRLREGIHKDSITEQRRLFTCATPEAVVQFLADNYRIPSLYPEEKSTPAGGKWAEKTESKPDPDALERFPVLPPPRSYPQGSALHLFQPYPDMGGDLTEESPYNRATDAWDGYIVARAWYSYSQEPLPDPDDELPGESKAIVDPVHQHLNRRMKTLIFRQYPARAQGYIAERLEEEGWFDNEGWSTKGPEWFSQTIGGQESWAANAWGEAFKAWKAHGERNHVLLSAEEDEKGRADAQKYRELRRLTFVLPASEPSDDPEVQKLWRAARFFSLYDSNRTVTAFAHHYNRAFVEQDPKAVRARKLFYQADSLASTGSTYLALQKYQDPDALEAWATILADHQAFREDTFQQEGAYETQLNYLDVLNRALPANEIKAQLGAALASTAIVGWLNPAALLEVRRPDRFPAVTVVRGPFDRKQPDGMPWIEPHIVKNVTERRRQFQPRKKDVDEGGVAAQPQPTQTAPPQPLAPVGRPPGPS